MFLFYIDESGNTGTDLGNPDQPVHWLLALGVTASAIRTVETELFALAQRWFPRRARRPEFEFHGQHIFQGTGECHGLNPAERIRLYGELVQVVRDNDCRLFVCGIDKSAHRRRARERSYPPDHPHRLGFMFLVERIERWLAEQQPGDELFGAASPVHGLLVADEQKEIDREIKRSFSVWREFGTEYGQGLPKVRHLIDTVHYVPSQDSWLIQLADCLAYLHNRYHRVWRGPGSDPQRRTPSEQAVVDLWESHCAARLHSTYIWP